MNAPNTPPLSSRSIGAILIDAGRLKPEDAERVLRIQREQGMRFGDAAIRLGLVTDADIKFALSRQFDYPYLQPGQGRVSQAVIAAYQPFSPTVEALRALRSQLMLRWFRESATPATLAIVSPEAGEGRSWLAANLAVVFSQLGERTLLIDADLRNPSQHRLFGLDDHAGLSSILSGRVTQAVVQRIPEFVDLSVLVAGAVPPNPQELLARPGLRRLLNEFAAIYDVILIDTPPASRCADVQAIAAEAGGGLMLARQDESRVSALRGCAELLRAANARLVGTVMTAHRGASAGADR
jgi:protein-tyrosine kinase